MKTRWEIFEPSTGRVRWTLPGWVPLWLVDLVAPRDLDYGRAPR